MRMRGSGLLLSLLLVGLASAPIASAAGLAVGEPAPPFHFEGDGGPYRLSDYVVGPEGAVVGPEGAPDVRKRGVVVAWFPKAFTPG